MTWVTVWWPFFLLLTGDDLAHQGCSQATSLISDYIYVQGVLRYQTSGEKAVQRIRLYEKIPHIFRREIYYERFNK